MQLEEEIDIAKNWLCKHKVDGWLLYSFHNNNHVCIDFLNLGPNIHQTRRFFYFVQPDKVPISICHEIEKHLYKNLPGKCLTYKSWRELDEILDNLLRSKNTICMEYSQDCAIPSLSIVDAGTVEKIKGFSVDVISSGPILEELFSKLTKKQYQSHKEASVHLEEISQLLVEFIKSKNSIYEKDVQDFILKEFSNRKLVTEGLPICAVGKHSANPHYQIFGSGAKIQRNSLILVDFWAKKDQEDAVFADITKMFFYGEEIEPEIERIFSIVLNAQKKAIDFISKRLANKQIVKGFEVDEITRDFFKEHHLQEYFTHRLGHSIETNLHGRGANLDSFETLDDRPLISGGLFSCEPGIYLPEKFGIRLELNAFIREDQTLEITTPIQSNLIRI